tara:strand:+ start:576 stop:1346 length:771 start_codon:yes stop_codon:yes gene_type:complete
VKIVIFTSNGIRHKFFANFLSKQVDESLVISECNPNDAVDKDDSKIGNHFKCRYETEKEIFVGNDFFKGKVIPIMYKEVNLQYIFEIVKKFNPDLMIVFGSSIIKEPLLSLKPNYFINLHLGLSPYYRGSGTNFWPFVNNELEYVGSTILHLDPGVDTGDIITHVKPKFKETDNVHTIGCKVIKESVEKISIIIDKVKNGERLNRTKQWNIKNEKYYKNKDFTEEILNKYNINIRNEMIKKFISKTEKQIKLITFD